MSLLGDKVEFGRIPFLGRVHRPSGGSRVWAAILTRVLARPGMSALLAVGVLLALAAPVVGLRTEMLSVEKVLPKCTPIVQRYEHIMNVFPGGPDPAEIVIKAPDIQAPQVRQAIASFETTARRSDQIGQPIEVTTYPAVNLAKIDAPLAGSGSDATSRRALRTLHDTIVPSTLGKIPGGTALVGGNLKASIDFNNQLRNGIVPVFLFVMGITFLLMLVAFRSIAIPATTIALNLMSVGAAYGAMVMVFQHGWGASLLGTAAPGAIESWIPLFVFVVLFGLSMDYNVFVVSRIKEAHDRGMPTRQAVSHGVRTTAGVVTSAAVIMVAVFAVFGTLALQQFKQLSVGLAVAVLIDATIVRGVLLPSVMVVLGERNWYLPRWLSWLPKPSSPPSLPPPPLGRPRVAPPSPVGAGRQ
jgi:RND superfamily putative drug exporter